MSLQPASIGLAAATDTSGASNTRPRTRRRKVDAPPESRSPDADIEPPAPAGLGLESGMVRLAPHDPNWTFHFEEERSRLAPLLGNLVEDIQHVGSTAVPGMVAKPVIDIAIGLDNLDRLPSIVAPLEAAGYEYHPEIKIPGEAFFRRHSGSYHVHILELGSREWQNYLYFREYLNRNPGIAEQYVQLKRDLAARFAKDRPAYTQGKADFIEHILAEARKHIQL